MMHPMGVQEENPDEQRRLLSGDDGCRRTGLQQGLCQGKMPVGRDTHGRGEEGNELRGLFTVNSQ